MIITAKTLKSGFSLPVIGLGTWHVGGSYDVDRNHDREYIDAIRTAITSGITHIDTAEMYAQGHSEELIAQAITGIDRSKLFITSKVWRDHLHHDDVIAAAKRSLQRLKTDYLDLYLIHWPDPATPLAETIAALDELVDQRLVRNIGVSNFSVDLLKKAQSLARHPIVCNQVHYSLMCRQPEHDGLLEYCEKNDVLLVAYRPLKGVIEDPPPILLTIAKQYGKTPAQIALHWLTKRPNTVTITKMTSKAHLPENLGAVGWQMDLADLDLLTREYPGQEAVSGVIPRV